MKESITVQGQQVPNTEWRRALKEVFDAIPKGKRAYLFREMSVVEAVGQQAFIEEPTKDQQFPRGD